MRNRIQALIDVSDGSATDIVTFVNAPAPEKSITVSMYEGDDGEIVIFLDTDSDAVDPRLRVYINDGSIFDRHVESDHDFGDDLHPNDRKL